MLNPASGGAYAGVRGRNPGAVKIIVIEGTLVLYAFDISAYNRAEITANTIISPTSQHPPQSSSSQAPQTAP